MVGKVGDCRTVISIQMNSSTSIFLNLLVTSVKQQMWRKAFFTTLIFLEHFLVAIFVIAVAHIN